MGGWGRVVPHPLTPPVTHENAVPPKIERPACAMLVGLLLLSLAAPLRTPPVAAVPLTHLIATTPKVFSPTYVSINPNMKSRVPSYVSLNPNMRPLLPRRSKETGLPRPSPCLSFTMSVVSRMRQQSALLS